LVVTGVGDRGAPTYKKSRRGCAEIDAAMTHILRHVVPAGTVLDFSPYGYDERQYCSPGFNLPVGRLQRSQFATFAEYHTSRDDLGFIDPEQLAQSYRLIVSAIDVIENNRCMINLLPKCEPQLGRRGLYGSLGGEADHASQIMAYLWVLNYSDGQHSLLDIANSASLPFATIRLAAGRLSAAGLLSPTIDQKDDTREVEYNTAAPKG
jgi:aminopeptidase-like protein